MGKMNGKAGNLVLATVGGEVVAREYNPNVANPNTEGQQVTRSRFKLLSQLAATMSPVIAIRKEGLKSARNIFTSLNYNKTKVLDEVASVNLNQIQLTKSSRSMVPFVATRNGSSAINVQLKNDAAGSLTRVVYIMYEKREDGSLILIDSTTNTVAGVDGRFSSNLAGTTGSVVIYAYGMKDLESGITTKFGNMQAPTAEQVAKLLISSNENMSSVQLTKTVAITMNEGTNSGDSDDNVEPASGIVVTVSVNETAGQAHATATGGGNYEIGDQVTVVAHDPTSGSAWQWNGWVKITAGQEELVSNDKSYTFTAQENVTLQAQWEWSE